MTFDEGDEVRFKIVPPTDLLAGLPIEDQKAIQEAHNLLFVEIRDDGKAELEFLAEDGSVHTIWVDPSVIELIPFG